MNLVETYRTAVEIAFRLGQEAADDCLADLAMTQPVQCLLLRELMARDPFLEPIRKGTPHEITPESFIKVPHPGGGWELLVLVPFQDPCLNPLDAVIEVYKTGTFPKDVALVSFLTTRIPELPAVELGGEGELNELCRLLDYPWGDGLFQRLDVYPNQ